MLATEVSIDIVISRRSRDALHSSKDNLEGHDTYKSFPNFLPSLVLRRGPSIYVLCLLSRKKRKARWKKIYRVVRDIYTKFDNQEYESLTGGLNQLLEGLLLFSRIF
jgi:hypothetical protein